MDRLYRECATRKLTLTSLPETEEDTFTARCGCPIRTSFTTNLWKLKACAHTCPMCASEIVRETHEKYASDRGGILSSYTSPAKPATYQCDSGHTWRARPIAVTGGAWCPHCAAADVGKSALAEVGAERGYRLRAYKNAREKAGFLLPNGTYKLYRPGSFRNDFPIMSASFYDIYTARAGRYAYVYINQCPPGIGTLMAEASGRDVRYIHHMRLDRKKAAKSVFAERIRYHTEEINVRLINVWNNPQWLEPGVYTWGTLPKTLAEALDAD